MLIDSLQIVLARAFVACRPVLITGAPGIGKTDVVYQAATAAGCRMIVSHPAVADPTDAKGLPWVVGNRATFLPFAELQQAIEATEPTVWFIDDLGQASESVQKAYMQLILARRCNDHVISPFVTFVAATNRRGDKAGVSGILEPVKSRFVTIIELKADVDSWCRWALDHDVAPELIAFLRFRPELLSNFVPSNDLTNSPTPRTWAAVAEILTWGLPAAMLHEVVAGAVGDAAATELLAFLKLYAQLPSIDAILLTPTTATIPTAPASLYAVASALAHRATAGNFDRIAQYVTRLMSGHAEFAALCVRDCERRCPGITQTTAYVRLHVGDFGQLISGSNR
jgi:MoxR-like ATPase